MPEHSPGENEAVGRQKEEEAPTGMSSLGEGGNYYPAKEHLPSERAGEVLSNGSEGASIH